MDNTELLRYWNVQFVICVFTAIFCLNRAV